VDSRRQRGGHAEGKLGTGDWGLGIRDWGLGSVSLAADIKVFALGWSRRRALVYGCGSFVIVLALLGYPLFLFWHRFGDAIPLLAPLIIAGFSSLFIWAYSVARRRVQSVPQREPIVTLNAGGVTLRSGHSIPWPMIEGFHVARDESSYAPWTKQCDLYVKLDRPSPEGEGFQHVYSGSDGTWTSFERGPSFLIVTPDAARREANWNEIVAALEDLAPRSQLARKRDSGRAQRVVVPQSAARRAIMGTIGLAALAVVAWGCWLFFIEDSFETIKQYRQGYDLQTIVTATIVLIPLFFGFLWGRSWLAASISGTPLLGASAHGIHHPRFGLIPWTALQSLGVVNLSTDDDSASYALVAEVSAPFYKSLGALTRLRLAARNGLFRTQYRLPLLWRFITTRHAYLLNGRRMPPEGLEGLAAALLLCKQPAARSVVAAPAYTPVSGRSPAAAVRSSPGTPVPAGASRYWGGAILLAIVVIPLSFHVYRLSPFLLDKFDSVADRVASRPWLRADDPAATKERWNDFWNETGRKKFLQEYVLRGTVEDYLRTHPDRKVARAIPNGVIYTNPAHPGSYFLLVAITSVQGNRLVLGPRLMPRDTFKNGTYTTHLESWTFPPVTVQFDEERHYAGIYIDRRNRCELFVIYERQDDWPMPVAPIFHSTHSRPNLVAWRQNEFERIKRIHFSDDPDYSCYPPWFGG
jgi:hypothetical protein